MSDGQGNQPCALHFWAQTHWFLLLVPDYPQKKKNHILHSSLLIAWPLACGVPKKRGKSMHIEEELSTKLFYYVYLCKWHIRLFKKVSVAPPLSALWSAFPPCSMDGWVAADGGTSVIGFTQTRISGECKGGWLFSSDSCQSVKWLKVLKRNCHLNRSSFSSLSPLTNSECLL